MTMTTVKKALLAVAAVAASGWVCGAVQTRRTTHRGPAGRRTGLAGSRIHYVQAGRGPDVILIHGTAMTVEDMLAGPFKHLTERYRVTAVDRPGHGYSDPNPGAANAQAQARTIREAIAALNLIHPIIVGHSIGAAVALAWAREWPNEVGGVVAVAPLAYRAWTAVHIVSLAHALPLVGRALSNTVLALFDTVMTPIGYRLAFAPQNPTKAFLERYAKAVAIHPAATYQDGRDVLAVTAGMRALSRDYDVYPVAVHVVVGDLDQVLRPARHGLRLAAALRGRGRLTCAPGVGHMIHHIRPDLIAGAVDEITQRIACSAQAG
jgi:pimeloyl-ACP methyl ester carboxylesterase